VVVVVVWHEAAQRKTNEGQLSQFKFNKLMYYVQEVTSHSNMPYMTCNDTHSYVHTHIHRYAHTLREIAGNEQRFLGVAK